MTRLATWSASALDYFRTQAIDPELAAEFGVRGPGGALVFPVTRADGSTFERQRSLNGSGPKVKQPGTPLAVWWPAGRPESTDIALVCEGESDALAALSALPHGPQIAGLADLPVVAIPGTGFPVDRLVEDLVAVGVRQALLALDADDAGRAFRDRAAAALAAAGIQPAPVELPDSRDLADMLAVHESAPERGDWLANLLADAGCAAEPLEAWTAEPPPAAQNGNGGAQGAGRLIVAENFAAIRAERTRWLWDRRIPLGTATLWVGREKLGKSTGTCEIAARLSRGDLAGDLAGTPADTLIVSYEDSAARTIKPRLMAAEADLSRVHRIRATRGDARDLVSLPDDVERIGALAVEHGARLVVVDPLSASLNGDIDSHRDQDIRRALAPLVALAEQADLAVLCVAHFNKAQGSDSLSRVLGSRGLTAAVRSVLAFGRAPDAEEDSPDRVLAHAASNLAPEAPSLACRIEGREVQGDGEIIPTSRLVIVGESDARADDLLIRRTSDERSDADAAAEWLADELADGGWHESREVKARAKAENITEKTLRTARERLEVEARREGFPAVSEWRLPVVPTARAPKGMTGEGTTAQTPMVTGFSADADPQSCPISEMGTTEAEVWDFTAA